MSAFPERLLAGYRSFVSGRFEQERERYRSLAKVGQSPSILLVGCCDSRAAPETIFDAGPGEVFVLRNVANLVPPYEPDGEYHSTSAALEYAVTVLQVSHVVVLGHGRCGGISSALSSARDTAPRTGFLGKWMSLLGPAADAVSGMSLLTGGERQTALERISIRFSIANLRTFPFVTEREKDGTLSLHGAWFDISSGELWVLDPDEGEFERYRIEPDSE
jgi:carbonic anhydrase